MNTRLFVRMIAPVAAISLLLLAVGVGTAWYVDQWQKTLSYDVRVNVYGVRAAEELEILVREIRTRLDRFLITGDRKYLREVPELRDEMDRWLLQAERWGITLREQVLTSRARKGQVQFWRELERVTDQTPAAQAASQVRILIDSVLVPEILAPAHAYLDLNEEEVEAAIDKSQVFADWLIYALLIVAILGSAAGLIAGFGFARGVNRSLIQLSVLIRDAAGRLNEDISPISYSQGDMGELEKVLRLITTRVGNIVERLQEKEHEALQAEQLAAVGQLAAGMAHELRNPLMSMKILVQGALAETPSEGPESEARLSSRDLTILEEEITRLEQLIQYFFDFARPPVPEKRQLDLRPLIEKTLALVEPRATAARARIEPRLPATPVNAIVDPGQFRQVLLNLLMNAIDALPSGGAINVELAVESNSWVALQVADSGCGLPAELGTRIFDPFTTTKATGLGLGLSICKRIAAAHGGTISGANREGGGAVFTLRLPAAPRETSGR